MFTLLLQFPPICRLLGILGRLVTLCEGGWCVTCPGCIICIALETETIQMNGCDPFVQQNGGASGYSLCLLFFPPFLRVSGVHLCDSLSGDSCAGARADSPQLHSSCTILLLSSSWGQSRVIYKLDSDTDIIYTAVWDFLGDPIVLHFVAHPVYMFSEKPA